MPKQSKITSTRPQAAKPVNEPTEYKCCRCEKTFKKQKSNFPASQSSLFKGNGGYLPICNRCVEELFEHYKEVLGSDVEAIKRICLKFDIYWNMEVYNMLNKSSSSGSKVRTYIAKTNLFKYIGKTYDDTLDEITSSDREIVDISDIKDNITGEDIIEPELVSFWGGGFTPTFYRELQALYDEWTKGLDQDVIDVGEKEIYKQICILKATINRDVANGKSVEKHINTLNTLLGSANLKPIQKKEEENMGTSIDGVPFGMGIKMCENTRPIPEPDPEFQDVDGIIRYISIWFLGHLCKMLRIKNTYSKLYEREMEKLRVERPEFDDEDDETLFDSIFESDGD